MFVMSPYFFVSVILLISFDWVSTDDPLWFPSLKCIPEIQENPFEHNGEKWSGLNHFREKAKECQGFEKDDPCLIHCVTDKWGEIDIHGSGVDLSVVTSPHFFLRHISKAASGVLQNFNEKMSSACTLLHFGRHSPLNGNMSRIYTFYSKTFCPVKNSIAKQIKIDKGMNQSCKNNPEVYKCLDVVMNCPTVEEFTKWMKAEHFTFSCDPKYIHDPAPDFMHERMYQHYCKVLLRGDDLCIKACSAQPWFRQFASYNKAAEKNSEKDIDLATREIADVMNGFDRQYSNMGPDIERNIYDAYDAAKALTNCAKYYKDELNNIDSCPANRDSYKELVECLKNAEECKY